MFGTDATGKVSQTGKERIWEDIDFCCNAEKEGVCLDHRHGAEGKEIWGQG